ncbi:hypothetical protein [Oleidesulfovibrio sp.]|uniref:hypothetical protein n=1 Tax=Oleidesulfovibrio sp. TaxID=2909707 RepID=UPI003A850039
MNNVALLPTGYLESQDAPVSNDPLALLGMVVSLEQGVTLRSFMQMLRLYPDFARLSPFFAQALAETQKQPSANCITDAFTVLQLAKLIELTGFPGNPAVQSYTTLRGTSEHGGQEHELRFISLGELLDMPLALGGVKHTVFGDRPDVLICETAFSLFDVIEGIAWEMGFQGGSRQCSLRR